MQSVFLFLDITKVVERYAKDKTRWKNFVDRSLAKAS